MSRAPTLQSLVEEVLAQAPSLCVDVSNKTHDALRADAQLHLMYGAWQRNRGRFPTEFQAALMPLLEAAKTGENPLNKPQSLSLDELSLVDERQALQDVAIAHVVTAVEDHCRTELHQLTNFFAALRGITRPLKNDNPLRPALFAQALNAAAQGFDLDPEGRYALIKVITPHLVADLAPIYVMLCKQLREANLTPMVASYGQGQRETLAHMRELATASHDPNANFDSLARRVDAYNARPAGAAQSAPIGSAPFGHMPSGGDMLSRLYDQILADPNLLPPVKALMARMQVAVVRLAKADGTLLRRQDHPTWQLLNRVAAHGVGFQRADDPRLKEFLGFMEQQVQHLVQSPLLTALQFQQALDAVEQSIRTQASQQGARSAAALAALERESQRSQWQALLQDQLKEQLHDVGLSPVLRKFLLKPWVEVIVQQMVLHGKESTAAHSCIELVDELLDSLQPRSSPAAIAQLRSRLPGIMHRLEVGLDGIAYPKEKRQILMQDLMLQHSRILQGLPPQNFPAPSNASPAPRRDLSPEELLQQLLNERESTQMPSRWAHDAVNRGELPTVPVLLYSERGSPQAQEAVKAWMEGLQVGQWYHMFVQSQWLTAQIAWISESRQFFLFVGQDAEERHSLTRGAIEQLLANGLITALEEDTLVQRAVSSLMQDLDEHP